jgi:aminopeptidase-like protein
MVNNELSGPVVTTALARWIAALAEHRFTYRIVFLPETIGSITYLSRHRDHLQSHLKAGWVLTCIGDDRAYSYLPSRYGTTLADRISEQVIDDLSLDVQRYTFLDRGSDERQYCSPGIDLPVASLMRTKYGQFPEYHTSLDDLTFVTPAGLQGGLDMMAQAIRLIEVNRTWQSAVPCEPQMGRRGLYPTTSTRGPGQAVRDMMNVLAYLDGSNDVLAVSAIVGQSPLEVAGIAHQLADAGVVEEVGPA